MFTGLIQAIGRISRVEEISEGLRFSIEATFDEPLLLGESIAVNGVCLTLTSFTPFLFTVDVIPATLKGTTLSLWETGLRVNLERALQVGDRLGGHFVLGHVDTVGTLTSIRRDEEGVQFILTPLSEFLRYIPAKGSVTLDGVSLTVRRCSAEDFEVSLIPHTLEQTTLVDRKEGDTINIEIDVLARYLEKLRS